MNGLYVLETENFFCVFYQMQIAARARVGFVAHHDARPLRAAHGVGAAVRQKVNINVLGLQREHVVIRFFSLSSRSFLVRIFNGSTLLILKGSGMYFIIIQSLLVEIQAASTLRLYLSILYSPFHRVKSFCVKIF